MEVEAGDDDSAVEEKRDDSDGSVLVVRVELERFS